MPGLIDTAADLIDVSGNAADGSSQFLLLGAIHFDDIAVDRHLTKIGSHVFGAKLIKYNGKTEQLSDDAVQLSFMDDSDVVIEEE